MTDRAFSATEMADYHRQVAESVVKFRPVEATAHATLAIYYQGLPAYGYRFDPETGSKVYD